MLKFFDADPGSGILLILDQGWKNSDPDSNIQINFSISKGVYVLVLLDTFI
jgi:hypothetical protein